MEKISQDVKALIQDAIRLEINIPIPFQCVICPMPNPLLENPR